MQAHFQCRACRHGCVAALRGSGSRCAAGQTTWRLWRQIDTQQCYGQALRREQMNYACLGLAGAPSLPPPLPPLLLPLLRCHAAAWASTYSMARRFTCSTLQRAGGNSKGDAEKGEGNKSSRRGSALRRGPALRPHASEASACTGRLRVALARIGAHACTQAAQCAPGRIPVLLLVVQVALEQELHLLGRQVQVRGALKQRAAKDKDAGRGWGGEHGATKAGSARDPALALQAEHAAASKALDVTAHTVGRGKGARAGGRTGCAAGRRPPPLGPDRRSTGPAAWGSCGALLHRVTAPALHGLGCQGTVRAMRWGGGLAGRGGAGLAR